MIIFAEFRESWFDTISTLGTPSLYSMMFRLGVIPACERTTAQTSSSSSGHNPGNASQVVVSAMTAVRCSSVVTSVTSYISAPLYRARPAHGAIRALIALAPSGVCDQ